MSRSSSSTVYGYGSQGYRDHDWGCVYRSYQNAMAACGYPVPSMPAMLAALGQPRGQEIEPAQAGRLPFHPRGAARTLLAGVNPGRFSDDPRDAWLQRTRAREYGTRLRTVEELADRVQAGVSTGTAAYVVDNGVSCYAVLPGGWWADPHVATPSRRRLKPFTRRHLTRHPGWMVLELRPS